MPAAGGHWKAIVPVLAPVIVGVSLAFAWSAADERMAHFRSQETVRHQVTADGLAGGGLVRGSGGTIDSRTAVPGATGAQASGYTPASSPRSGVSDETSDGPSGGTSGGSSGGTSGPEPGRPAGDKTPANEATPVSKQTPVGKQAVRQRGKGQESRTGKHLGGSRAPGKHTHKRGMAGRHRAATSRTSPRPKPTISWEGRVPSGLTDNSGAGRRARYAVSKPLR